jgi:hypothetical protein
MRDRLRHRRIVPFILLSVLGALPARGWSNKEHIQLTRIAAAGLVADAKTPAAMKQWLREACPELLNEAQEREYWLKKRVGLVPRGVDGIPYWAVVPDMAALMGGSGESEKKVEPFGVGERMLHFVDLEYFQWEENRRRYRHDLKNKPDLATFDKFTNWNDDRWKKAGMLPFRVEQCYRQLVKSIREKKLTDKMGQFPRDEHAARWAGYLAHYVQDNTQPHHSTEDYRSRSYFLDKRGAPNVHWDFEGRICDDEENDYPRLREEFWGAFKTALAEVRDPIVTIDPRQETLEVALMSYDALPLIGLAAMEAYGQKGTPAELVGRHGNTFNAEKFFHYVGTYQGREMSLMEMKARQMAWGVKRTQILWRRAWEEAKQAVEEP